jgi:thiol:disulfide interchange protein DsbD
MPAFESRLIRFFGGLVALGLGVGAQAAPHVQAELVAQARVLAPGEQALAVRLTPEPGWHTYWRNPGQAGQATQLHWNLPDGYSASEIHWPTPVLFSTGDITSIGYEGPAWLGVTLTVPQSAVGTQADLTVEAHWLACSDACVPEHATLQLQRAVGSVAEADPQQTAAFASAAATRPQLSSIEARYAVESGHLKLRFAGDELNNVPADSARWLPAEEMLVADFKPLALSRDGNAVMFELPLDEDAGTPTAAIDGLLLAGGHAYPLQAQPGDIPVVASVPATAAPRYLTVLLFAFLGGLVLNLMPCVFPVLSIKAVSLMQGAGDLGHHRRHALVYTLGVVLSFTAVAAVLLVLRAGGQALGWGFQLQSPLVVAAIAYLLFAMGLSLSGAVHFGGSLMGLGQGLASRDGYAGSFFTGVLAVIVASPCTAPFMGTALGFAMTQAWPVALSVFAVLGLGLASPFVLLALWPAAARALPRPGAWMETFKQLMAFPLYFTVVWLLWVLARQAGLVALVAALTGLVLIALAIWGLAGGPLRQRVLAPAATIAALVLVALSGQAVVQPSSVARSAQWEPYSDQRLAALRAEGRSVFVDLTADWCITCKVNERIAIDVASTQSLFADHQVALLRGDWTRSDPRITTVLERFGRNGVPLYVLYPPQGEPTVLPQLLTPSIVADALAALPSAAAADGRSARLD